MTDAKPILSPAQVEQCARLVGIRKLPRAWFGVSPEHGYVLVRTEDASWIQRDGRFLFPLETLLMERGCLVEPHSFYATHGTSETWAAFEECDRDLFDKYLRGDSHADVVLEAAKVKFPDPVQE